MSRFAQIVRGAIGIAIAWGMLWFVTGIFIAPLLLALNGGTTAGVPLLEAPIWARGVIFGIVGGLNGIGFSLALALSERKRKFSELSTLRMIGWGIIGGLSYPAFVAVVKSIDAGAKIPGGGLVPAVICAVLSAASAWATIAIARRAVDDTPSQLGSGPAPDFHSGARERAAERQGG